MMRGWVVVAVLLLAACSEGATPRPSPSPAPTPVALTGPVVAVVDGRALDLYTVDAAGPRATLLRTLQGPTDSRPVSVSVSGGEAPTVCAVWELPSHRQIHCYDAATGAGREVPQQGSEPPDVVAVSHDGSLVAWSTLLRELPGDESTLYWSPVAGGALEQIPSRRERLHGLNTCCGSQVEALAWRGDNRLVVSEGRESDDGTALRVVPVRAPGWADAPGLRPAGVQRGLVVYGGVTSPAKGDLMLGVLRPNDVCCEGGPVGRAVEFDVTTGRVAQVVSVPATGREIWSVSGGERGVLYATLGDDGVRRYWRRPGERHGRPLAGLPADDDGDVVVVAQA